MNNKILSIGKRMKNKTKIDVCKPEISNILGY